MKKMLPPVEMLQKNFGLNLISGDPRADLARMLGETK